MSVPTFPEVLQLPVIASTGCDSVCGLHVIDGPVWLVVISCDLVWAVPVVSGSAHASVLTLVGVVGLLSVAHSHAVHMLRLALADHGAHRLWLVVWTHRGMLAGGSIVSEIYVVDSTLPHLIFRRHRHLALHVPCVLRAGHVRHLLVPEIASVIVHYWENKGKSSRHQKYILKKWSCESQYPASFDQNERYMYIFKFYFAFWSKLYD